MRIHEDMIDGVLKLSFVGSLDETSAQEVERHVTEKLNLDETNDILFDLSNVKYISSIGIRSLIIAHKHALKLGKKIIIGDMSDKARDILTTVGVLPIFSIANPI